MTSSISTQDARRALDAALGHAEALGAAVCVVIVDGGGNVLALVRMDGATFLTTTLATNKALTAAGLGLATKDLAEFVGANPLLLAGMTTQPAITVLPGGLPVPGGAVGVAGGTNGEDQPIAEAAAAALAAAPLGV